VHEILVSSSREAVDAASGERIVVRLPENATTGYRWVVDDLPAGVGLEADELVPPGSGRPGAAAERRVTLVAREPGTGCVVLRLVQPWADEPGEAADRFELLVTVR
jgi:predicted secreted protein